MPPLSTKTLLKRQGLAPHKKLGQNFLVDEWIPRRIVDLAGIDPEDQVLEVGVGLGALTLPLAEAAKEVIGLEADAGIIRLHREQQDLPANVHLLHADVLKVDFQEIKPVNQRLKIVTNLPYAISSPFLFRLLDHADLIDFAMVMLQKEVARRLSAQPGTREYGAPTVLLAACASVTPLLDVPPSAFHPQPKVDSQVIRITFHPQPAHVAALGSFDQALFTRIVHAAFGQRRKTLLNGLVNGKFAVQKEQLITAIEAAGLNPSVRAETLPLQSFIDLTRALAKELAAPADDCTNRDAKTKI